MLLMLYIREIQRRLLWLLVILAVCLIVFAPHVSFAAADDTPPPPTTGTQVDNTLFHIPASTVMYIMAVLLPLVGGLVMRYIKSNNARVASMLVLNAINALFNTATTAGGDAVFSSSLVNNFLISTTISLMALFGIYKRFEVGGASIDKQLKGEAA